MHDEIYRSINVNDTGLSEPWVHGDDPLDFGRSVNPISTRGGGRLCSPHYHLPPSPSGFSDLPTDLLQVVVKPKSKKFRIKLRSYLEGYENLFLKEGNLDFTFRLLVVVENFLGLKSPLTSIEIAKKFFVTFDNVFHAYLMSGLKKYEQKFFTVAFFSNPLYPF